ncbi:hypothetical protein OIE62_07340 [Streptomyces scopuliridis]|uniref:Uncharacterized protein n=1 Tax=Streptomyces scopuliridis TaxID=452529 RepID=A0ACD4ZX47_9ACTN|nr:hypothetical protein [Streptomyces scopuliridis]WSC01612.1 hypothetical protein OG835_34480 [Streptomyces scopuliridis]WSC04849.1 hypothetical protein OIE62_07340 [Streptomyces scopuliridis]
MDPSTDQGTHRSTGAQAHFPRPARDEASVRGFPRPVRARVTGPDNGIDLELVQRLTWQALGAANNGAEHS